MQKTLLLRIRLMLLFFMAALLASGITAFPLVWELGLLVDWFGPGTRIGNAIPPLADWLVVVQAGLAHNAEHFPFMAYGTDWLAFAHLMIAAAYLGPLRDPIRNLWVVHWGMICCVCVLPLAFICGAIRDIPFGWRCIDCCFGVFGIVPLILIHRWTRQLEHLETTT